MTAWGITHDIRDNTLVMNIHGYFNFEIVLTYLSIILSQTSGINGFILQMSPVYVPNTDDFSNLMESIESLSSIRKVGIVATNNTQAAMAKISLKPNGYKDMEINFFLEICDAINWRILSSEKPEEILFNGQRPEIKYDNILVY